MSLGSFLLRRLGSGARRRPAVIGTLAAVVAGSALTVLPLPFVFLLIGRGIQGAGLGLPALMMGVARDHPGLGGRAVDELRRPCPLDELAGVLDPARRAGRGGNRADSRHAEG